MKRPFSRVIGLVAAMVGLTSAKAMTKETTSTVIPFSNRNSVEMDTPQVHNAPSVYTKTPLTKKQKKARVRNQMAKQSRRINRLAA